MAQQNPPNYHETGTHPDYSTDYSLIDPIKVKAGGKHLANYLRTHGLGEIKYEK
jgi:hypothetical protein